MNKFLLFGPLLFVTTTLAHADAPTLPAYVSAAVADHARPDVDTARDGDRKPAELVALAGIKPGDKVADLLPGSGYFTRIFSKVVGPKGHVYAVIPASVAQGAAKKLDSIKALAADPAYSNVTLAIRPYDQIGGDEPLDVVWTSQNYHDVYGAVSVFAVPGTTGAQEAAIMDVAAFKALKPGGIYLVTDHVAKVGSGEPEAKSLHRIDPAVVIAQASAAGFVLEARSDILGNPKDGHEQIIFAPEIKGHTDQFVLKFRKPR
ncbi:MULTISPECIES: class I SAM-dependent methyltransferase [unclassified Dyella]|uniref:class I SAM-dependent methyltransferase n=1 Tax=unclassified Dyella TaxID=2634549 RepID=UPI000CAE9E95|nr:MULTISPECIES: class I SAM-dependent methyltransferase [unclassified Dyella]MDR3443722.1 class I SAM-dependent methyltransferase [Dyella sp.]PMQ04571.1 Protein-L-isoaspartate O-methyltransferase [Dyella sp. AD56]